MEFSGLHPRTSSGIWPEFFMEFENEICGAPLKLIAFLTLCDTKINLRKKVHIRWQKLIGHLILVRNLLNALENFSFCFFIGHAQPVFYDQGLKAVTFLWATRH
jgi:hypothetical protein